MDQDSDAIGTILTIGIVLLLVIASTYLTSLLTGWHALAKSYKTRQPMPPGSRLLYQASFRYWLPYRYVLIVGATPEGFYLKYWPRLWHPNLFIPWSEIEIKKPTGFSIFKYQTMMMGKQQKVSLFMPAAQLDRLLKMAGTLPAAPPPSPYAQQPMVEQTDRSQVGLGPEYKG